MLAMSAFGSHQPLLISTHISKGTDSEEAKASTLQISADKTDLENGKESTIIRKQDSMIMHLNQRLREVTKTLNRSTVSRTGEIKIRKK